MANNAVKISDLPIATTIAPSDRLVFLRQPNGNPSVRTISLASLTANLILANTTAVGVVKVGNNLSVNATGFLSASFLSANTGDITFNNNIISTSNNSDNIYINHPNNAIQIGGSWLTQMSATSNAAHLFGDGNTTAYSWVYQEPDNYAEHGSSVSNANNDINHYAEMYLRTDTNRIFQIHYSNANTDVDNYLTYTAEGNLSIPGNFDVSSNLIYIGQGMGPMIYSNTSLFVYSQYDDGDGNQNYSGSLGYPNTYQLFTGYNSNTGGYTEIIFNLNNDDRKAEIGISNSSTNYNFTFDISANLYSPAASFSSDKPLVVQSNNYVTTIINTSNNGFAELWWNNPDPQRADMPVGSDFYVEGDGAWLYNSKFNSSNNYVGYGWNWDMNGVFNIPNDGDIKRNGVSVIGTGQIDGGNAFTTPTAEITVDGGGA